MLAALDYVRKGQRVCRSPTDASHLMVSDALSRVYTSGT